MSLQHYWRDTKEGRTALAVPAVIVVGPFLFVGALAYLTFIMARGAVKGAIHAIG